MDTHIWQENDTDRLMHQIHQTMRLFAKTLNQEIARSGIYSSEWTVLNLIHHRGECAQAELSPYLGIEPAAISKTLVKMEEKGVITRVFRNEPRGKFVRLTEKGEDVSPFLPEYPDRDTADQQGFGDGFDQFSQAAPGEQARQALDRVQSAQIRIECLQREVPTAEQERGKQGGHYQG